MRQRRAKVYRRAMHLYHRSFGFREPYQVLLDASFLEAAVGFKMELGHILKTVLQGEVKPMITQCCIEALYRKGREYQPVVDVAKLAERRKCNHRDPLAPADCLKSVVVIAGEGAEKEEAGIVSNKHRYIVGTQDKELRLFFRLCPAVPLLYLKRSVLVLEPTSQATTEHILQREKEKRNPFDEELAMLKGTPQASLSIVEGESTAQQEGNVPGKVGPVRRKRAKGPNPLSVKKAKPKLKPHGG